MPGSTVARAAATAQNQIPILMRPERHSPVLLVPGRSGRMRAYDVKSKKAKLPRAPFDTAKLLDSPDYELIPIESRVFSACGNKFTIEHGYLRDEIPQNLIYIIRFGEISLPKPPRPGGLGD